VALSLARVVGSQGWARVFYVVVSGFLSLGLLLTNSRGGMLAFLVVVGGFFLVFQRQKLLAIAAAGAAILLILAFGPSRMTTFDSGEESANQRFWFWDNALKLVQQQPLTGVGYRRFTDHNGGMTAHNTFVSCFVELGLPGYFLWMGCVYYALRTRPRQEGDATSEEPRARSDLLGARLALAGILMSCFWISRTYIPVLYLIMTVPVAAQLAYARQPTWQLPIGERRRDWGRIVLVMAVSFIVIWLMVERYK
jgi:O-antigen ligase